MEDPGRGDDGSTRRLIGWLLAALVVLGLPAMLLGSCSTREGCESDANGLPALEPETQWYGIGDAFGICV